MVKEITQAFVRKLLPKRDPWSHKGDFGKLLIIGGSQRYSGAPSLSAIAAYRTGCDLVEVAAPERAADIIATFSPDIITEPLRGSFVNTSHVKHLLSLSEEADAVVIGSGLGREKQTLSAVKNFLNKVKKPCLIDADAIHAIQNITLPERTILTPHSKEFFILDKNPLSRSPKQRSLQVRKLAKELNTTILLKGNVDFISDGYKTALSRTGNPYMTKGGTGDTLTGICGALLTQGNSEFDSACAAAYMNGAAGDLAFKEFGPAMMASDLLFSMIDLRKELGN
jgi:NAD(P)H-hydrate epimerase